MIRVEKSIAPPAPRSTVLSWLFGSMLEVIVAKDESWATVP